MKSTIFKIISPFVHFVIGLILFAVLGMFLIIVAVGSDPIGGPWSEIYLLLYCLIPFYLIFCVILVSAIPFLVAKIFQKLLTDNRSYWSYILINEIAIWFGTSIIFIILVANNYSY